MLKDTPQKNSSDKPVSNPRSIDSRSLSTRPLGPQYGVTWSKTFSLRGSFQRQIKSAIHIRNSKITRCGLNKVRSIKTILDVFHSHVCASYRKIRYNGEFYIIIWKTRKCVSDIRDLKKSRNTVKKKKSVETL